MPRSLAKAFCFWKFCDKNVKYTLFTLGAIFSETKKKKEGKTTSSLVCSFIETNSLFLLVLLVQGVECPLKVFKKFGENAV